MEGRECTKRTLFHQEGESEESDTSVNSNHSTGATVTEETTTSSEEIQERQRSRGRGRGKGPRRAKRARVGEVGESSQAPPESGRPRRERSRSRSRGRRGERTRSRSRSRGRRGGRRMVRRGGIILEPQQVQQLQRYQENRRQRLQTLVDNATPACLRGLVTRLAERQPGLVMDLLEEQGRAAPPEPAPPAAEDEASRDDEGDAPPLDQPPRSPTPPPDEGDASPPEQPPRSPTPPPDEGHASPPEQPPRSPTPPPDEGHAPPPPQPPPAQQQQPEWCVCSNCGVMPEIIENLCCGNQPAYCLSQAATMDALILDAGVLMLHRLYRGDVYNIQDRQDLQGDDRNLAEDNKSFRHAAYRQFILWQHGVLGHGNRRVVPSCCTLRIRRQYPDPMGHYVGFRFARLE